MANPVEHQWVIPSDTAAGQVVQESIIRILEQEQFSDRDVFGMRLALEEGIVNAIKHGNRMDASKKVHVTCLVAGDLARVVIRDEGPGFNPESVPDPTADENIERPCGRGIMLMRAFMSLIEYNAKGNELTLEKRKESAEVEK